MNFLSEQERTELRAQHKKERDRRICDRIKATMVVPCVKTKNR